MEDPRRAIAKHDSALPIRENPRKLKLEPIEMKSSVEKLDPSVATP
jgi:hypothetical protein